MRKSSQLLILLAILAVGTFFRTFDIIGRFDFAHDGDLYSWIVKDIVINHHFRLIGQLTSAPGIFIGPVFYYLLIPYFLIFNMDPIAGVALAITVSLLTLISFYFVFTTLFNKTIGLIVTFLDATLLYFVQYDRWVVPTIFANLWVVWYFYSILKLARGNFAVLPLLGILIGLIWHVHIALLPALLAVPVAILLSKKLPSLKQFLSFLVTFSITFLPLMLFEIRHSFSQTHAILTNFTTKQPGIPTDQYKLFLVLEKISRNVNDLLFAPQSFPLPNNIVLIILLLLSGFWLLKKKLLKIGELISLYTWFIGVVVFFSLTPSPISEYYFFNLNIIFLCIVSLLLYFVYKSNNLGKVLVFTLFGGLLIKNIYFFTTQYIYHKGYVERKAVTDFIASDSKLKNYPCFAITYITSPGENVGFRYFFYLNNLHIIKAGKNVPVYNIVLPDELAQKEIEKKFGHIGIITPKGNINNQDLQKTCEGPNTNLTDPMLGYTE